uniref:WAPL domain-containing protein n=1 Tax=Rhabditophanes sp. KR3021 TaxID=114890 RepID=A0AC35TQX7_9BILA
MARDKNATRSLGGGRLLHHTIDHEDSDGEEAFNDDPISLLDTRDFSNISFRRKTSRMTGLKKIEGYLGDESRNVIEASMADDNTFTVVKKCEDNTFTVVQEREDNTFTLLKEPKNNTSTVVQEPKSNTPTAVGERDEEGELSYGMTTLSITDIGDESYDMTAHGDETLTECMIKTAPVSTSTMRTDNCSEPEMSHVESIRAKFMDSTAESTSEMMMFLNDESVVESDLDETIALLQETLEKSAFKVSHCETFEEEDDTLEQFEAFNKLQRELLRPLIQDAIDNGGQGKAKGILQTMSLLVDLNLKF